MKISVMMHSASRDNLFERHGIQSALETYINVLNHQTFSPRDFEFVFVDYHWPDNYHIVQNTPHVFPIKYVPCVRDYWKNRGIIGISAGKNSVICFSEGELLISLDDGEIFHDNLLDVYWNNYKRGFYAHALHKRFLKLESIGGKLKFPYTGEYAVYDHRWTQVNKDIIDSERQQEDRDSRLPKQKRIFTLGTQFQKKHHRNGGWLFAGTSYSLQDALELNGFNERMDGCKSLEDCEFGARLQSLGRKFVLDKDCFIYIVDHSATYIDQLKSLITKENFGFIAANRQTKETKANHRALTSEELKIIDEQTMKYRHFNVDWEHPDVQEWVNYQPFSLAEERERHLADWYAGKYKVVQ